MQPRWGSRQVGMVVRGAIAKKANEEWEWRPGESVYARPAGLALPRESRDASVDLESRAREESAR